MARKKYKPSYWEQRSIDAEKRVNDGAKALEKKVAAAYRQAQSYLTKQVRKMFSRSQQRTGLSEDEAKRLLNETVQPAELVELKSLSKQIKNPLLQKEAKQKLNGLAFKERITRAEDLKAKSFLVSKQVANVQLDKSTDFYIDTIHDSYNEATSEAVIRQMEQSNSNSIIEVWNKKNYESSLKTELPKHEFKELSTRYTKNILDSHWKGSNYSDRIWGDTETLAKRLEELFTVESMTGMSEFEMAKAISSEFDRSINVARRLIRTEANYMANQAKLKAWQDRGVEQYRILAVLDLRTSKICQSMDGKVFNVKDAEAGVNLPSFHPFCRSTAVAYFGERSVTGNRIANDPISDKKMTISQRDNYNDWMNKLTEMYSKEEIKRQKKDILSKFRKSS